jgi:hypothetical protein
LWRTTENRRFADRSFRLHTKAGTNGLLRVISPSLQARPFVAGVKTGNWHVFPIDNPAASARIAFAGARALSLPPRLMRGNR